MRRTNQLIQGMGGTEAAIFIGATMADPDNTPAKIYGRRLARRRPQSMVTKEQSFSRIELEHARNALAVLQKVADKRLSHAVDWNASHIEEMRVFSILMTSTREAIGAIQHDCEYR